MKIKNFIIIIIILGIIAISFINIGLFTKKSMDNLYNSLETKYGKGYGTYIKDFKCNKLTDKIKYIDSNYFIDEDGYLYYYNAFNNDRTCNAINSEQKFKYIIDNKIFVSEDDQIFYTEDNNLIEIDKKNIANDSELIYESAFIKQLTIDNPNANVISKPYLESDWKTLINNAKNNLDNDKTIITYIIENEKLYILKYDISINNDIINYNLKSKDNYNINIIDSSEKILNVYYEISSYNEKKYNINFPTIIKTDKNFYMINVSDKNCLTSTDIECKFDFYKSSILTDNYTNIAYVDNQVIIGYNSIIYPLFSELYQYFN